MVRLEIVDTGEFFVLGDSTLSADIVTTLFNKKDDFLGSKVYPFKFLIEPNRRQIRNGHYRNASNAGRKLQVRIWLDYLPYKQGEMIYRIDGRYIDGEIHTDGGIVAPKLKWLLNSGDLAGPEDQLNFDNPAGMRDYMMSTIEALPGTKPMYFFPWKNDGAYNEVPESEQGNYPGFVFPISKYINAWQVNTGSGVGTFTVDTVTAVYNNTQTPFFTIAYVLRKLLKALGYEPAGKWLDEEVANRIVIASRIATLPASIAPFNFFMPGITIADFFKEIRTRLGLLISFDQTNMVCLVESIANIKAFGKVVDLRGKQLRDTYRETGATAMAYSIAQVFEDKDGAFSDSEKDEPVIMKVGDISDPDNIEDITLISVHTKMLNEVSPASVSSSTWRIPYIKIPIAPRTPFDQISSVEEKDRHDFKLRLLYYHGMQEDQAGYLYPYGSADNLDKDGDQLTDFTLGLNVNGTAYSSLRDYYTYLKNSKPFEEGFLLNRQDLLELQPNCKVLVYDEDYSTVVCLLDATKADLDKNQDVKAILSLYPEIFPDNAAEIIPVVPVDPPEPPVENGPVYVKMETRNIDLVHHQYPPPDYNTQDWDIYAVFYQDAAGTIPKQVTNLEVRVEMKRVISMGGDPFISVIPVICTSALVAGKQEKELYHRAPQSSTQGGTFRQWFYRIMPSADYTVIS